MDHPDGLRTGLSLSRCHQCSICLLHGESLLVSADAHPAVFREKRMNGPHTLTTTALGTDPACSLCTHILQGYAVYIHHSCFDMQIVS